MTIDPEERKIETILDQEALDTIRSLEQPGTPSLLERVINTYLETSEPIANQIGESFSAGDADALMHASHSLKSSSANVGAKRLAGICAEIEKFSREGELTGLDGRVEKVESEYALVKEALKFELSK